MHATVSIGSDYGHIDDQKGDGDAAGARSTEGQPALIDRRREISPGIQPAFSSNMQAGMQKDKRTVLFIGLPDPI